MSCYPSAPFCNSGDLRLFGGQADNEGTLELCLNQAWGTVCDDLWDNNDAKVACRKLGFQAEGNYKLIKPAECLYPFAMQTKTVVLKKKKKKLLYSQ